MYLIKNAIVYDPNLIGICDVLIGGVQVLKVGKNFTVPSEYEIQIIEGEGKILFPGLIDLDVPVLGAGTEAEPCMDASVFLHNAVTTVVGAIKPENEWYTMKNLLSRTRELRMEGIQAFCFTGSYRKGFRTLQESILDDLLLLDPVVGVGEIPIAYPILGQPDAEELKKVIHETKIGSQFSGKKGVTILAVGEGEERLSRIRELKKRIRVSASSLLPVHVNRNRTLLEEAMDEAKKGTGYMGLTANLPDATEETVCVSKALRKALDAGVDPERIIVTSGPMEVSEDVVSSSGQTVSEDLTSSSDMPVSVDLVGSDDLEAEGGAGQIQGSFYRELRKAVLEQKIPLETVLKTVTTSPARLLGMKTKGRIQQGYDADLILADRKTMKIEKVFIQGKIMEICLDKKSDSL